MTKFILAYTFLLYPNKLLEPPSQYFWDSSRKRQNSENAYAFLSRPAPRSCHLSQPPIPSKLSLPYPDLRKVSFILLPTKATVFNKLL